jgi:hypothetical protein
MAGRRAGRGRERRERGVGRERRVGRIRRRSGAGRRPAVVAAIVGLAIAAERVERRSDRFDQPQPVGARLLFLAPASQAFAQTAQLLAQRREAARFRAFAFALAAFLVLAPLERATQVVDGALERFEIAADLALRPRASSAIALPAVVWPARAGAGAQALDIVLKLTKTAPEFVLRPHGVAPERTAN